MNLKDKAWWDYLTEDQRDLLEQSRVLLEREENKQYPPTGGFHDYAFIVFPAAKAYEGFLKKLFCDLGLITLAQYGGNHFRIGKALNPSLEQRLRREGWVYEELAKLCQGYALPDFLWETWKQSRNLVFHWFPKHKNFLTLEEARARYGMILEAVDKAFSGCKIK